MTPEEYWISEAEKAVNRKIVTRKIEAAKRFFNSATYKVIVWDEDDDVEWYEEDTLTS
jgi:hypothetical protein